MEKCAILSFSRTHLHVIHRLKWFVIHFICPLLSKRSDGICSAYEWYFIGCLAWIFFSLSAVLFVINNIISHNRSDKRILKKWTCFHLDVLLLLLFTTLIIVHFISQVLYRHTGFTGNNRDSLQYSHMTTEFGVQCTLFHNYFRFAA